MQKIEVNFRPTSDDPNRSCGSCNHFHPDADNSADGRCFGNSVTREGLCDLHSASDPTASGPAVGVNA